MTGPLAGRRLVVTRGKGPSTRLAALLEERGASVLEVPSIEIVPPPDWSPLDEALSALPRYGWVVLTSANAVAMVLGRIAVLGLEPRLGGRGTRLASVGRATTAALGASFPADRVALEPAVGFRAEALVAAFAERPMRGVRVLVPSSTRAREELARGLRELGAEVDVVPAVNQIELHPVLQHRDTRAWCKAKNVVVEAYSPLGNGRFLNHPAIGAIAKRVSRTPAQVLLRWGVQHGLVTLPKSVREPRIAENAALFDFTLDEAAMTELDGLEAGSATGWDPRDQR